MEPPAEICENYQLKWSSYTSYIHACIANSLVAEDSFADVALVTMDGHKIMAHRFVLAYSSQYLCKALKFQPKVTTALPIMVVLPQGKPRGSALVSPPALTRAPPGITYKALKILVKYMYSGEATVSKDILNTVLKAGDILKVKGLYREAEPPAKAPEAAKEAPKNPPALVAAPKAGVKKYGGPRVLNFTMSNFNGLEKEAPKRPPQLILNQKLAPKDKPHTITSAEAAAPAPKDNMFLLIKDEPVEWVDADMEIVDEKVGADEEPVKAEYDSASNEGRPVNRGQGAGLVKGRGVPQAPPTPPRPTRPSPASCAPRPSPSRPTG